MYFADYICSHKQVKNSNSNTDDYNDSKNIQSLERVNKTIMPNKFT